MEDRPVAPIDGVRAGALALWLAQLLVPAALVGYAAFCAYHMPRLAPIAWAVAAVGALWVVAVLASVLAGRGRRWVTRSSHQILVMYVRLAILLAIVDITLTVSGVVETIGAYQRACLEHMPAVAQRSRLKPNQLAGRELKYDINSHGFRGPEVPMPKPPGTTRIVFLGGSHVFSTTGENWPVAAGELLSSPERPVDVINAAVPGHCTADSLGKLVTDLWMSQPDVIVVCHAWNDIKYFKYVRPERPYAFVTAPFISDYRTHPTGIDRLLCVSSLYRLARRVLLYTVYRGEGMGFGEKPEPVIQPWGYEQFRLNLETICDVGKTLGARVVLATQSRVPTRAPIETEEGFVEYPIMGMPRDQFVTVLETCDRVIAEVAAKKDCPLVDMNAVLSGKLENFSDPIHLSPKGSERAAELMAKELEHILSSKPSSAPTSTNAGR